MICVIFGETEWYPWSDIRKPLVDSNIRSRVLISIDMRVVLGKPLPDAGAVQTKFWREGGGWKPFLKAIWEFHCNVTEKLDFYHTSPFSTMISITIPSKDNVWPLSLSKYIHFNSQNSCFQKMTKFRRKKSHKWSICLRGGRGLKRYSTEFLLNSTYCWHWQGLPLLLCLNIELPLTVGNLCHLYISRLEQKHKYSATRGMRFICTFSLSFPLVNKFQTSTSTGAGCWEQLGVGGDGGEEEGGRTAARGRGWQVGTSFSRSSLKRCCCRPSWKGDT